MWNEEFFSYRSWTNILQKQQMFGMLRWIDRECAEFSSEVRVNIFFLLAFLQGSSAETYSEILFMRTHTHIHFWVYLMWWCWIVEYEIFWALYLDSNQRRWYWSCPMSLWELMMCKWVLNFLDIDIIRSLSNENEARQNHDDDDDDDVID